VGHLKIINEEVLQNFDRISPNTDLPEEKRITHEKRVSAKFPPISMNDAIPSPSLGFCFILIFGSIKKKNPQSALIRIGRSSFLLPG